jgi:hypothetical protein
MLKKISAFALCLGIAHPLGAMADDTLVKFRGGIGVIPVSSAAGAANADGTSPNVNRNVVRGVNPPGQIWVIADLRADIKVDGRVKVRGKALLLGGGNGIGSNGGQSVHATLICEATAPFSLHDTNPRGIALEANGDFRIDDVLSPGLPSVCASPVLLIRNPAGVWFAAGIPDLGNDE